MDEFFLGNESWVRMGAFGGILALFMVAEALRPRRARLHPRTRRWFGNLGVVGVSTVVARATVPVMPVALAIMATERGWGLLNQVDWPLWVEVLTAVLVMDLVVYLQHVLFHATPTLWRLHRMHHADTDIDVTTGIRFHPLEIILSLGIKLAGRSGAWASGGGGAAIRSAVEWRRHVQPCQPLFVPPGGRRAAVVCGDAGHAPCSPFLASR